MSKKVFAVAWANGLIEFKGSVPKGACVLCRGPEKAVREFVGVTSRHGHKQGVLLVPGVPEAKDQSAAMDALLQHREWLSSRLPAGVSIGLS